MYQKNYRELKSIGNVEIITVGGGYAVATKKWDPNTGESITPEIVAIDQKSLTKNKATLLEEIADIETMEADIKLLQNE